MLFRPPPRRAPPLEAPFDLDLLPELMETVEGLSSAARVSSSASSSRKASSRKSMAPVERRQSNDSLSSKGKRKVATLKHAKSQLVHDPAADDALLESLRREHGDEEDGNHCIGIIQLEHMLKQARGEDMTEPETEYDGDTDEVEVAEESTSAAFAQALLRQCGGDDLDVDDRSLQTRQLIEDLKGHGPGAMAAFKSALADGQQPLNSVKLCFVGHARAGKTSTLRSLAGRAFNAEEPSTHGVETASLRNELLQAEASTATPWSELGGGLRSVGELLERSVASTVAERIQQQRSGDPAMSSTAPSPADEPMFSRAHMLRMPVDLIVRAVNEGPSRDARDIVMQTWDFAGDDLYYNMAHVFLTPCGIYCLVLDLSAWYLEDASASESLDFWLSAVFVHAPESRLVIVGSHADAIPDEERSRVYRCVDEHLEERLDRMPSLFERLSGNVPEQLLFFPVDNRRCTAEGRHSIDNLRATLNRLAVEIAGSRQLIPTRWAHFFHELSQIAPSKPFRSLDECQRLPEPFGLTRASGELQPCLALFHRLGQLLYFKGSDCVVLDPQWLLDAMAQVVGCPRVLANQPPSLTAALRCHGRLNAALLQHLWAGDRFRDHIETLEAFLEHFDLLVPALKDAGVRWLVPSMLPSCRDPPGLDGATVVLLDFHGALRKLLVTLLPRLLCQLQRIENTLKVISIYRDTVSFRLGEPPVFAALDLLPPASPVVVRLSVVPGVSGQFMEVAKLKWVLETVRKALRAWLPQISFAAKIPCPECSSNAYSLDCFRTSRDSARALSHVLDMAELMSERHLYCTAKHRPVTEKQLPVVFRRWRQDNLNVLNCPPAALAFNDEGRLPSAFVTYMYASPLGQGQLDVASEMQALQQTEGISAEVHVATTDKLCNVLVAAQASSVILHLTAHCSMRPVPSVWLEDECSGPRCLSDKELAEVGPWGRVSLLIFLGCGSELLVRRLLDRCGPFPAVCCNNPVFDSAAKNFVKAFYHALGVGSSIEDCYRWAQQSVRFAGNGMQQEADKFVLIGLDAAHASTTAPIRDLALAAPSASSGWYWPQNKRVEQYIARSDLALNVAQLLLKRKVGMVWGQQGIGKTAFCREFCYRFSAPGGRLFSKAALFIDARDLAATSSGHAAADAADCEGNDLRDRLARLVLSELAERGPRGRITALAACGATSSTMVPASASEQTLLTRPGRWQALLDVGRQMDGAEGLWLLVVDGLRDPDMKTSMEIALVKVLQDLLDAAAKLRILLTSSGHWKRLGENKIVGIEVEPLPPRQAALLFARNMHRRLYLHDFEPPPRGPALQEFKPEPLREEEAFERLEASKLLRSLGGVPGRLIKAADEVDERLPSLLQHSFVAGHT